MHRIIKSNLGTFCEEKSISESIKESKQFEYFANYCVVRDVYGEDFDVSEITSDEDDGGIDGIAFLIDHELVFTYEEAVNVFSRHKKNVDVDIYFIQAKTSESYDRGEILKFGDGVDDFLKESSLLPHGTFIKAKRRIFDLLVTCVDKITNGCPNIVLRYVCTSDNEIAKEIEATRAGIIRKLESTRLFNSVDFQFIGVDGLISLWKKSRNAIKAQIPALSYLSFMKMKDIGQAYLIIVSAKQYVQSVLMDENGKLRGGIFDENVRAFLGEDNIVNRAIEDTINKPDSQNRFAILNNGITIISPEVNNMGSTISLSDYQIVNGCQTSNMLFNNYGKLDNNTCITVRIIQVENADVIAEIVKATNSQTKVEDNQFLAFATLFRRIELFFDSVIDSETEIKLYLERRQNQFRNAGIPKNRIYKLLDVCRAVESMYYDKPDEVGRNPNRLIKDDIDNLCNPKNKEVAYYAAALALYRINSLVRKGKILNEYTIYRWQLLMIIKYIVSDGSIPKLTNKKDCERYCSKLIKILVKNDDKCTELFESAIAIIDEVGKTDRDTVRTANYTQKIINLCKKKYLIKK